MFDASAVRKDFQALQQTVHGRPLVYLDSAATTLKPDSVVHRITEFYSRQTANVHRGAHFLSDQATRFFEASREATRVFVGAESTEEIIFTRGTTDGINLIASSYGKNFLKPGDEIVLTELEHHSNIVPWQNLAQVNDLKLRYVPALENGELDLAHLDQIINERTKLVAFTGCSNTTGTLVPVDLLIARARTVGAVTVMDAAQYVSQRKIDVRLLNVDFLVFSSHKLFGPYGFGVLYGKKTLLEKMPPYQFGGSMINEVRFDRSTYNTLPFKFEAGTPHIEGAIGAEAGIIYFAQFTIDEIFRHEQAIMRYFSERIIEIPEVQTFGTAKDKAAIMSLNMKGAHHADVGQILDQQGIAVRVGHHCTQPLLKKFNLTGTVRASFSIYNTAADVDALIDGLKKAKRMLL